MEHKFIGIVMLLIFLSGLIWAAYMSPSFRREVIYPLLGVLAIIGYIMGALKLLGV